MLQVLVASVKQITCVLRDHRVSLADEEKLFRSQGGHLELETTCERCHYPLLLRLDPSDRERNYYMLMER